MPDTILKPAFNRNNIPVALSSDNNYASYLAVTIKSIIANASAKYNYDIVILEKSISDIYKKLILKMITTKNISIRFVNISKLIQNHKFHLNTYFSEETYYRLFIPTIFKNFDKVIYLDCDLIVLHDLSELYTTNLNNNILAATWNVSTLIQTKYNLPVKNTPWKAYLRDQLHLTIPENYFQAGVLLLNINEMKKERIQEKAIILAESFNPILVDQDILNSLCQNKIIFFSQKWNFHNNFSTQYNNMNSISELPENIKTSYLEAKKNPFIIHYAGSVKPWHSPNLEYSDHWWHYARMTPFYEEILFKNLNSRNRNANNAIDLTLVRETANYLKNKITYWRYRLLSKITFGKKRRKYKQKRKELKTRLKQVRAFLKEK